MKRLLLSAFGISVASGLVLAQTLQQDNPDALTLNSSVQGAATTSAPPSDAELLAELRQKGGDGRAVVSFERRLNDNQVRQILAKAGVRPFAVLMQIEGMTGTHQVPENKASLDVIDAARTRTATMQDRAIKGARSKAKLITSVPIENVASPTADDETGQALLASVEQSEKLKRGVANGQPTIYAAYVLGAAAQLEALKSSPQVVAVKFAYLAGTKSVLPASIVPADAKTQFSPSADTKLKGPALKAKLAELGGAQ